MTPKQFAEMDPVEDRRRSESRQYGDDVAGGLMVTELLRYQQHLTVGDVVEDMRLRADEYRDYDVQYAYVCDTGGRLTGSPAAPGSPAVVRDMPIDRLMIRTPVHVLDNTSLDDLADFFIGTITWGFPSPTTRTVWSGLYNEWPSMKRGATDRTAISDAGHRRR